MYKLQCSDPECDGELTYDGRDDSVFHFSSTILFTHDVLREYSNLLDSTHITFTAFATVRNSCYASYAQLFVSARTFQAAWFQFVVISGYDYEKMFSCPKCAALPASERVYILDGTSLAFELLRCQVSDGRFPVNKTVSHTGWTIRDRALFHDQKFTSLLMKYANSALQVPRLEVGAVLVVIVVDPF